MLTLMLDLKLKWAFVIPRFRIKLSHTDGRIDVQDASRLTNISFILQH